MKNVELPLLKTEFKNHVLWLTLNNPNTSNSITYEMIDSLVTTLNKAERDEQVRVVVITGEGKNFSSGGDLNNMLSKTEMFAGESDELRRRYEQGIQQISRAMEAFSKPLIAMVNGAAAGAGCDLACMCDIRIGTEGTKFLESFVKVGLVPGDGGSFFLQRVVGYAKAMELTLTGRAVHVEEALRIGLLNRSTTLDNFKTDVEKTAAEIASLPPTAVQLSKKAVKISYQNSLNVSLDLLASYQAVAQRTQDHFEALMAIKENRKPEFTGK
ncbi:MAG: enoyl-CoA hydratase-related protein [Pseudobdellovibrio sp.]